MTRRSNGTFKIKVKINPLTRGNGPLLRVPPPRLLFPWAKRGSGGP